MPQYIHIILSEQINMVHQLMYKFTENRRQPANFSRSTPFSNAHIWVQQNKGEECLKQNALYKVPNCTKKNENELKKKMQF